MARTSFLWVVVFVVTKWTDSTYKTTNNLNIYTTCLFHYLMRQLLKVTPLNAVSWLNKRGWGGIC
eukprot:SAG31_NODE_1361_length_8631_cov_3.401899_6_plen_65_part_00